MMARDKKRMLGLDRQLVAALCILLLLYSMVTLVTFVRMPHLRSHGELFDVQHGEVEHPTVEQDDAFLEGIEQLRKAFPVHVGDDMEVIDHPGLAFADTSSKGTEKLPPKLKVPRFWDPPVYGDVRKFLGNYGETLLTPEQASQIGSFHNGLETIYISVASYRDPECGPTVASIFDRAIHPERIRVAIVAQRTTGDAICTEPPVPCDQDPSQALCKYKHLIDVYEMEAKLAVGPVFARHLGHRLYRGEYFAAQIDSHVRFVQGWDDDLVGQWKSANNEMGVLTTYLSDINGSLDPVTHASTRPARPIMCKTDFEGSGKLKHIRHGQQPEGPAGIHGQPTLHPFWAAGFSFARGHFVVQVPYDQYLPMVFQGEEISLGLRGFSFGYDYYTPERSVCFHMYAIKANLEKRKKVKLFWENSAMYKGAGIKAMQRLNGIIGMDDTPYFNAEEKKYGLGKVRNPDKFYATFGIHLKTQTVENHLCRFVGKPMMNLFLPALRPNGMGLDYDKIHFEFKDPDPTHK